LAVEWIEGDALQLPFAANQFDAATMGYGLRNLVNIPLGLSELYRVLKPGAKVAVLDFHRPESTWMQSFQQWYLDRLVVPLAESLNLKQEYAYIMPSLDRFPTGRQQVELARQAGFATVTHYPIAGGMMGVLVAQKKAQKN
jgi:demethylphylloquinol methyltransferase